MIDIRTEKLLGLAEAARSLPGRVPGKQLNGCTLYRWVSHGVRGIKLESIPVGGDLKTSEEALTRFFERLADKRNGNQAHGDERVATAAADNGTDRRADRDRKVRAERAQRKLKAMGAI